MELPSHTDLRRVHFSGGEELDAMRVDAIKGCLWRAKLTVSGSKSEIKERLEAHLELCRRPFGTITPVMVPNGRRHPVKSLPLRSHIVNGKYKYNKPH